MQFVLFHGSFGSPDGNWFPYLKRKLESLKQKVIALQFPVEDWEEINKKGPQYTPILQNLNSWFKTFAPLYQKIKKKNLCFIGHSLGPLFILHLVDKYDLKLESAIFVSPFMRKLNIWQFDLVNKTFYKTDFNFRKLKKLIPFSYTLYSDNDPYVPKKESLLFARNLGSSSIEIKNGGHLNAEAGFFSFPLVFELCKTRLGK